MKTYYTILIGGVFALIAWIQAPAQKVINIPADYQSIQEGIDQSNSGDTLIVAPGTYFERLNFKGKDIVVASRYLTNPDTTFIYETIINADAKGPAVVFKNGESSGAVLMGFTIKGGSQDSVWSYGGGIVCEHASPMILNNYITGCYSVSGDFGGGIVCNNSQAIIRHNVLDSNGASFFNYSGAIISYKSSLKISDNTISNMSGGYVFQAGGGIVCIQSDVSVDYNVIIDNYFFDNINGGIFLDSSSGEIINNTIFRNARGVTFSDSNSISLINNIIWGSRWPENIYDADSSSWISCIYNDIGGGYPGTGNIDEYPDFVDTLKRNLRLKSTSPCIDAGNIFWFRDPDGTRVDMGAYYFDQNSTGIQNNWNVAALKIYPNPAKNKFKVDLSNFDVGSSTLHFYNLKGETVRLIEEVAHPSVTIYRDNLPPGLYLIDLCKNSKLKATGKVIFE